MTDAIDWPDELDAVDIWIVNVPADVHDTPDNSDEMPVFEYIAKNVGIRRASGEYVLSTNPGIIFNEPLIGRFATEPFTQELFYRIRRYGVEESVSLDGSVDGRPSRCQTGAFRISTFAGK